MDKFVPASFCLNQSGLSCSLVWYLQLVYSISSTNTRTTTNMMENINKLLWSPELLYHGHNIENFLQSLKLSSLWFDTKHFYKIPQNIWKYQLWATCHRYKRGQIIQRHEPHAITWFIQSGSYHGEMTKEAQNISCGPLVNVTRGDKLSRDIVLTL